MFLKQLLRVATIVLLVVASMISVGGTAIAADTTTCDDFTTQEEAQAAWDAGLGRPRADYTTGMDADSDGIPCEHLPTRFQRNLRLIGLTTGGIAVVGLLVYIGNRRISAAQKRRLEEAHFPGRTTRQNVEDDFALLEAERRIDREHSDDPR